MDRKNLLAIMPQPVIKGTVQVIRAADKAKAKADQDDGRPSSDSGK